MDKFIELDEMIVGVRIHYPSRNPFSGINDGRDEERDHFYALLAQIKEKAVSVELFHGDFYDWTTFRMADGRVFAYLEDAEYGVPCSLELEKAA